MKETGTLPITDPRMTRFWITLEDAVKLVLKALNEMQGGEIFVPKIPSMKVTDLAEAIAPECEQEIVGIRPGEKLHEVMIPKAASRHTIEFEDHYVIEPDYDWWQNTNHTEGKKLEKEFEYNSGNNDQWLSVEEMRKLIEELD
jgi:UDP-N-acetylglucosamine 4,6-dehydratase